MNIEAEIIDYVREWTVDFVDGEREALGQIYEDNRDYVDRQLLEFVDFVRDILSDSAIWVADDLTEEWKGYKSSGLEQRLTFEEFVSVRKAIARNRH